MLQLKAAFRVQRGGHPENDAERQAEATSLEPAGAPDFPLSAKEVEKVKAAELQVALLARRAIRVQLAHNSAEGRLLEGRKALTKTNVSANRRRLRQACDNVLVHQRTHQEARTTARREGRNNEGGEPVPTPPGPSPEPEEVVDLTADEAED